MGEIIQFPARRPPPAATRASRMERPLRWTPTRHRYLATVDLDAVLCYPCTIHEGGRSRIMWYTTRCEARMSNWLTHAEVRPLWTATGRPLKIRPVAVHRARLTAAGRDLLAEWNRMHRMA